MSHSDVTDQREDPDLLTGLQPPEGQPMSRQPVDEVVSWAIRPTPARVRAAGVGQFLVRIVAEAFSYGGFPERPDALRRQKLPASRAEPLNLAPAFMDGHANWLPPSWAGKQMVSCGWDAATINPKGFDGSQFQIPLTTLRVTSARPTTRWSGHRHATARWVLTLTDGADTLTLTGPWLTLAWIGHLGNWPEPPRTT
jgi:hypothetical protein